MSLGGLLINRRTNRKYRLDGCRRSRIKPLLNLVTRPFSSLFNRQQPLPNTVDLRSLLSPIEEQSTLGSCVGNALASIIEYFYFYTFGYRKFFSRLFIYYNARMLEDETSHRNAVETDSGADLQFAILSLIKFGCCEEQYWPFYEHLINIQPHKQAYDNGQKYRLNEFRRLSNNINELRDCLAQGYPFVMAIKIYSSFASNHHGFIPMPKSHEKSSQYRHAVVCVGYIHSAKVFIVRNSHGIQWGDRGYGYLPYEYVTDKVLTKDLWALTAIRNMEAVVNEEQRMAWNKTPVLSRSMSQQDMIDDQSNWDIVYSSDDDEGAEHKNHRRRHSQEHQREYAASPPLSVQQDFMQPSFMNNVSLVPVPTPFVFTHPPVVPYYPSMFASTPFFPPF